MTAPMFRPLYMPLLDDTTLEDPKVHTVTVTPEQRDSVMQQIGSHVGGTVSRVADALNIAGDYTRGFLAGKTGDRLTGRELLRAHGLVGSEDNWGNAAAGLVTDIVTDPLTYLTGPAASLTKAGRAAKLAGVLDDAATIASKKALANGDLAAGRVPGVVQRTHKALANTGRNLSAMDPAMVGRPLFGTRTAQRYATLEDFVTHADDQAEALKKITDTIGLSEYNALKSQPLSKTFGVAPPLGDAEIVGDFLGKGFGDAYANALDTVGQRARWSYPGRVAAAMFDQKVGGAVDPERQITNTAKFAAQKSEGAQQVKAHVLSVAKLHSAVPEAFTDDGGRRLGRLLEVPEANWNVQDAQWVQTRPALREYIDEYKQRMPAILQASRQMGMPAQAFKDKYGIEYLPRQADPILQLPKRTDDTMGRTQTMSLPGGRDTIIELSQDAQVSGPNRVLQKPEDAAAYLKNKLTPMLATGSYGPKAPTQLTDDHMLNLARVLAGLPDQVTQHTPLFGQHPIQMIGQYLEGRGTQMGTAKTMYDSLATYAVNKPRNQIAGAEAVSLPMALKKLGLESFSKNTQGASAQMRQRLEKIFGAGNVPADLTQVSIPKTHLDRLTRAKDTFQFDEPSNEFLKGLDHYTQLWRGSILAWPSRATRDLYSGAASNYLEGAFDMQSVSAVKQLLADGATNQTFLQELAQIPRYGGNDGVARFYSDLAGTRLMMGPTAFEPGAAMRGKRALDPIIGSEPLTLGSIIEPFASNPNRSWRQFAKDFGTWRSSLTPLAENANPLLKAGEKMNSLTDGINRLSGYLALMKKGYSPEAAAAAMKRVHADYSSLSDFEKNFLKTTLPWYSYQSRIFREVLRQLIERPGGRYGTMLKATERAQEGADDEYIPSSLRQSFAAPLPDVLGGRPAPGTRRYVSDVDLPGIDQINMIETPGTLSGTLSGTARQLALQTHPLIRTLAEGAFGTDLFSNRPLGEATSPLDAIARSVTGNRSANVPTAIEKLVELVPLLGGRPLYTARSLLDDTGDASLLSRAVKTAANATTGLKFRDVTPEQRLSDASRQIEQGIDPYTREFKQTYIPEEFLPAVPQWAQDHMAVKRQLDRENKKLRDARQGMTYNSSLFD